MIAQVTAPLAMLLAGYLIPKVRDVEILLPDHDAQRPALAAAG